MFRNAMTGWLFILSGALLAQSPLPVLPADVQYFGPLVIVATHEDSSDPVSYRGDLLGGKKEDRMRVLRAMGMESLPAVREVWESFLARHAGESDDKGIEQFISGGLLVWNFGEPGSKQAVLDAGFDETSDHPLQLRGIYNFKDGHWTHVATVACLCQMRDNAYPIPLRPWRDLPQQDWVVEVGNCVDEMQDCHLDEIHFRLRAGRLWPLIQFENWSRHCPQSSVAKEPCKRYSSDFEKTELHNDSGTLLAGFVVISYEIFVLPDRKIPLGRNPKCAFYLWDEAAFSYRPTNLKSESCGVDSNSSPKHSVSTLDSHSTDAAPKTK